MPSDGNERKSRRRSGDVTIESSDVLATGRAGRLSRAGSTKEDWIADQLRRVYDEALDEGIPDEMLALLEQLEDGKESDDDGQDDGGEGRS